jgi:manganese transport protein
MLVIVSVLGAVVMPHNLFLHSEVIQSRQWNLENEEIIEKQLKYEFMDTFFSMIVGWAINSAMIILAAATFFAHKINVKELEQAEAMLRPILGNSAAIIFALALLFAGVSSSITACMASGSIVSGIFQEPYDIKDNHTRLGVIGAVSAAMLVLFFIEDSFKGLVISQMLLSMQLPITIFSLIYLTSSEKVMGKHKNKKSTNYILFSTGVIVTLLNIILIVSYFIT